MKLEIITPEQVFFSGNVESVTLPGTMGSFTVWKNHAPIISSLGTGKIIYKSNNEDNKIDVIGGFVEVNNNVITVCLELL
jgi:F-type H+-transporting ATPase subunit epsilon